ncbi:MAG: hypothetical protein DDT42_01850 [candidate division WS2 bacterium]|uniref:Uncharacterized protein n=1 Tax=Psychracetigena formicireducens TaxID=2986056 RepID=A0A9E2BJ68_PSYF1|nr:hypothetical protein [Candidatus Psychracetigena formicireducens]
MLSKDIVLNMVGVYLIYVLGPDKGKYWEM